MLADRGRVAGVGRCRHADKARVALFRDGETGPLRALLDSLPPDLNPRGGVTYHRFWLEFYERDFSAALAVLASSGFDHFDRQDSFDPISLLAGYAHSAAGAADRARSAFDSARVVPEAEMRERPDDPRLHMSLGLAYAGLGRRDGAVRHGVRATELVPNLPDLQSPPLACAAQVSLMGQPSRLTR